MNNAEIDNAPQKHANLRHPTVLITLLSGMLLGGIADTFAQTATGRDNAIQHLRNALEQPFVESGGFSTFDCTLTSGEQPEQPFTCSATSQSNNHYEYLLVPDADAGVKVDLVTEPAAQLDYEWLPALEETCYQFLKHFNEADWPAMFAEFNPGLQKAISVPELESSLSPIRELLGLLGKPALMSYSSRDGGRDELQYSVPAENGTAAFRCGLSASDVTLLGYLVMPAPDTPLYKTSLEENAATQLSASVGAEISRIEIPYAQLPNVYDVAEGVGFLDNGERFRIRITRSGRQDDFSQKDYTFQVLED